MNVQAQNEISTVKSKKEKAFFQHIFSAHICCSPAPVLKVDSVTYKINIISWIRKKKKATN